jgi:hypothetical protein
MKRKKVIFVDVEEGKKDVSHVFDEAIKDARENRKVDCVSQ